MLSYEDTKVPVHVFLFCFFFRWNKDTWYCFFFNVYFCGVTHVRQAGGSGEGVIGMEATVLRRFMEEEDDEDAFDGMDTPEDRTWSMGEFFVVHVSEKSTVQYSCIIHVLIVSILLV